MLKPMTKLLAALRAERLGPTVNHLQVNGKTTFRWHVDNDDDRYVEATDSLHSPTFVLHRRDKSDAIITVVDNIPDAVRWIDSQLSLLRNFPK
jgi:hypothetical protein